MEHVFKLISVTDSVVCRHKGATETPGKACNPVGVMTVVIGTFYAAPKKPQELWNQRDFIGSKRASQCTGRASGKCFQGEEGEGPWKCHIIY